MSIAWREAPVKCSRCGRELGDGGPAADPRCPSCGAARADAAGAGPASSARRFARFVLVLVAIGAGVAILSLLLPGPDTAPKKDYTQARVVMYSLTTCAFCNMKRAELKAHGIPFTEYFIDQDPARQRELFEKLLVAGYKGGGVGTPTFEVNGKMLPNNPSLATIRKHL